MGKNHEVAVGALLSRGALGQSGWPTKGDAKSIRASLIDGKGGGSPSCFTAFYGGMISHGSFGRIVMRRLMQLCNVGK